MNFRIEQRIPAPLAAVEAALLDRDFVAATADLPKLGAPELLENERDGDRAHQRIRYRFTAPLSGAVTHVVDPAKLTWVDDATYDLASHTSRHRILPDNYADRLQAALHSELEARRSELDRDRTIRSISLLVTLDRQDRPLQVTFRKEARRTYLASEPK